MEKTDYGTYELKGRERLIFLAAGYAFFFIIGFLFYRSLLISALLGLLVLKAKDRYRDMKAEKRRGVLIIQFRDLLYSLSSSMATGSSMADALVSAAEDLGRIYAAGEPIMRELAVITTGLANRESDEALLRDLACRSRSADIAGFTDVYLSVRSGGGDTEKIITRTCEDLMDRITIEKDIEKTVSQKKLEADIITAVPLVILAALNIFSPEYIEPMYTTLAGRGIMTLCLGAMIFAYQLTDRITDIRI